MNDSPKVDWFRFFLKSTPVPIVMAMMLLRQALGGKFIGGHWFCLVGIIVIFIVAVLDYCRSLRDELNSGSELYDRHRGMLILIFYLLPLVVVATAYIIDLMNSIELDNKTGPISIKIEFFRP